MRKITKIINSDIAKNSAKLLSANIISQVIALLIYPLITRLYTPADFGLFNLFTSIGGIVILFATAEYQYAIVLPKERQKAIACFQVGFFILIVVTIICFFSILFQTQISALFNTPALGDFYFLLPFYVFFSALWILLNYWHTRNKNFSHIATYQITQSSVNSASKYGFGLMNFLHGGLIVSSVFGPLIALIISVVTKFKENIQPLFLFKKETCKTVAQEYSNFPKYSLPRTAINYLSGNLPFLLFTPFFGIAEVGFFGMALALAFRPINMISGSLYQVFYQKTSESVNNKETIMPFFKKFIRNALLLITPFFAILYFALPWLTDFLLGDGWGSTSDIIRIMLPWLLLSALAAPICYIVDVFQEQKIGLWFEVGNIILVATTLLLGVYVGDFLKATCFYYTMQACFVACRLIWFFSIINTYEQKIKKQTV